MIIIINTEVTHKMILYNGTEQWPTYLLWGLLLTTIINIMIWNEHLHIWVMMMKMMARCWWMDTCNMYIIISIKSGNIFYNRQVLFHIYLEKRQCWHWCFISSMWFLHAKDIGHIILTFENNRFFTQNLNIKNKLKEMSKFWYINVSLFLKVLYIGGLYSETFSYFYSFMVE